MRAVLDACVLVPHVMRDLLIGAAKSGVYTPLWSAHILEEWRIASLKYDPARAAIDAALLRADFPDAMIAPTNQPAQFTLPDPDDEHVLQSAIEGRADLIITKNHQDFPTATLGRFGITRSDPDVFLAGLFADNPEIMKTVTAQILERDFALEHAKKVFKSEGLHRFYKVISQSL
jgi:predicted nucleic acid-binding protein